MADELDSEVKKDRLIADVLGVEVAITPSDLCNQQFKRSMFGGYRPDEVDVFLERTANAFEFLLTQMKSLKDKNEEQSALLEEYREMEEALRNAIVSSQQFGQDIIENAKREAHVLVQEGRLKKSQFELEAAKIPAQLSQDIRLLQEHRARIRRDILAILETHRRLLENLIPEDSVPAARTETLAAAVSEQTCTGDVVQTSPAPEENAQSPAETQPAAEPEAEPVVLLEVAQPDAEPDVRVEEADDSETPGAALDEQPPETRQEDEPEEESLHVDA